MDRRVVVETVGKDMTPKGEKSEREDKRVGDRLMDGVLPQ